MNQTKNKIGIQEKIKELKEEMIGRRYLHFKGNIYVVTDIATNTETEEIMVVYKTFDRPELTWCRPFNMFSSEVDHKKYPNIKQKMRFEKVGE